jgi:hypothetical protein
MPFSTPTKNGSERAVGKVLTRTKVSSAAMEAPEIPAKRHVRVARSKLFMSRLFGVGGACYRDAAPARLA